jgi:2-amino-4-hydroxy-6-hydroxymethyldihydropteridine diphosphokinase
LIEAYIALGSNLGDRLGNLSIAVERMAREPAFFLRRLSRAYETEPVGPPQPRYLNAVVHLGTLLSARATLQRLLDIEEQMGRVHREKWSSREIDLDLIIYGDRVASGNVELPHPRLHERAFVLAPLAELAPDLLHPGLQLTAAELLALRPAAERAGVRSYRPIRRALPEPGDDD